MISATFSSRISGLIHILEIAKTICSIFCNFFRSKCCMPQEANTQALSFGAKKGHLI
jgi:hypothetical protein